MANPQVHARSSARKFGGSWQDFVGLHALIDSSKLHYARAQHRALLHHEWGKNIVIQIYTERYMTSLRHQCDVIVRERAFEFYTKVVEQHLAEDFTKFLPTVTQWFEGSDSSLRPNILRRLNVEEQCAESVRYFGGVPEDYEKLHTFLDSITSEVPGAWGITHSTFGLGLAEEMFGYVVGLRNVPTRTVAEKHILAEFSAIPSAQDWLCAVPMQSWMYNQAATLSSDLDELEKAELASQPA